MLFKEARLEQIRDTLELNGHLAVSDLATQFGVSEITIRRDLRHLAERGTLRRAHGGALAARLAPLEPPVHVRMEDEADAKDAIARAAISLLEDGQTIFLGAGTTTLRVAQHIATERAMTVITNSLSVATTLATSDRVTVQVTGGILRQSELDLLGILADRALQEVRVDRVLIGIRAISVEGGLTNDDLHGAVLDRSIISIGRQLMVLADHSKFGRTASAFVADLQRVTTLVTDAGTDPGLLADIRALGVDVVVAPAG